MCPSDPRVGSVRRSRAPGFGKLGAGMPIATAADLGGGRGGAADPENATSVQGPRWGTVISASVTIAETPGRTMVRPGFRRRAVCRQRCGRRGRLPVSSLRARAPPPPRPRGRRKTVSSILTPTRPARAPQWQLRLAKRALPSSVTPFSCMLVPRWNSKLCHSSEFPVGARMMITRLRSTTRLDWCQSFQHRSSWFCFCCKPEMLKIEADCLAILDRSVTHGSSPF